MKRGKLNGAKRGAKASGTKKNSGQKSPLKIYQKRKRLKKATPAEFSEMIYAEGARQRMWIEEQNVARIEGRRRKIWALAVSGAVVLFFVLLVIDAGSWFGWWPSPNLRQKEIMEEADLIAIGIFAVDIYSRYRAATDKMLFLRRNALEIIAILPMGVFLKLGQAFEAAGFLRNLQAAARVEEMSALAPALNAIKGAHLAPYFEKGAKIVPEISEALGEAAVKGQSAVANLTVTSDFFSTLGKWISRIGRIGEM